MASPNTFTLVLSAHGVVGAFRTDEEAMAAIKPHQDLGIVFATQHWPLPEPLHAVDDIDEDDEDKDGGDDNDKGADISVYVVPLAVNDGVCTVPGFAGSLEAARAHQKLLLELRATLADDPEFWELRLGELAPPFLRHVAMCRKNPDKCRESLQEFIKIVAPVPKLAPLPNLSLLATPCDNASEEDDFEHVSRQVGCDPLPDE